MVYKVRSKPHQQYLPHHLVLSKIVLERKTNLCLFFRLVLIHASATSDGIIEKARRKVGYLKSILIIVPPPEYIIKKRCVIENAYNCTYLP